MRIIFLCGSLEPGRDGVGDYSRRLAGELIKQTHQVAIVALNDKHLQYGRVQSIQCEEFQKIKTLRLSSHLTWKERTVEASKFIDEFDPDWISLQYVPFSFHEKGMPYKLVYILRQLIRKRKLHIMFHEVWVGVEYNSSLKMTIWGFVQKMITKYLLTHLKPNLIHTQSKLYQYMLSTIECTAGILPLFSNIPVTSLKQNSFDQNKNNLLSVVIFGGIHENALIREFAREISAYARSEKKYLKFIFLGRNGKLLDEWVKILTGEKILIEIKGEQPIELISEILANSTFGITTTPLPLIDKSGSVSAMIEHGINVICIRDNWKVKYRLFKSESSVIQYNVGGLKSIIEKCETQSGYTSRVNTITENLIKEFHK